jgi:hypothetical protein
MRLPRLFVLAACVCSAGCLKAYSDQVATGVGRLTIRNLEAIVRLVSSDERCGFASPAVASAPVVTGVPGERGAASWTISACTIDLPDFTPVATYCDGTAKTARGSITVSAVKTLVGYVSGDPHSPIIPDTTDAVTFELTRVTFRDFKVRESGDGNVLTMKSGSLSASASPRLAMDQALGVCAVATRHAAFGEVRYDGAELRVKTPDRTFDVDVPRSDFSALAGQVGAAENHLAGTITVWDKKEKLPSAEDHDGLDPDYDRQAFVRSFACDAALAQPISFACDLTPAIARGAAQLSMRTLGALARLVSDDATCGFAAAGGGVSTSGAAGDLGAATETRSCTYELSIPTAIDTDCNGVTTYVQGRAEVRATKSTRGYITGSAATPVVPTSRDAVHLSLEATLTDFVVTSSASASALHIVDGAIAGDVRPRLGLDAATGVCSIVTPVTELTHVRYTRATQATLETDGRRFTVSLDGGELDAVRGIRDERVNELRGALQVNGEAVTLAADTVLDPDFEPTTFAASFACDASLQPTPDDAACSMGPALAQGTARLIVHLLGKLARTADLDTSCGFESASGMVPEAVSGLPYTSGSMTFGIEACTLASTNPRRVHEDCAGRDTFIEGAATVTARRRVNGRLVVDDPPIEPMSPRSVRVDVDSITLADFTLYELRPGELAAESTLRVKRGTLSGALLPVTAESASKPGIYFIKTPVAGFEGVRLRDADVTLQTSGMRFNVRVDDSELAAFNGSFGSASNRIAGTITLDGRRYELPLTALDPDFDQASFDASYACTPDLARVVR